MKKLWFVTFIMITVLILGSIPVMAAAPDNGKGPLDKIVFVHYPKNDAARGGGGGSGDTTLIGLLCPDYKYQGIHWGGSNVNYYVNEAGAVTGASEAIQASFATWNAASSKITFHYAGEADTHEEGYNGENVVFWGEVTYSNAIAVTYIWYSRATKLIAEVDTVMNDALPWDYTDINYVKDLSGTADPTITGRYADPGFSGVADKFDIRNIMTHEAGHWILLNDLYNARDNYLTMYGYGSLGEIKKDTLGYGDEMGIEKAYGP